MVFVAKAAPAVLAEEDFSSDSLSAPRNFERVIESARVEAAGAVPGASRFGPLSDLSSDLLPQYAADIEKLTVRYSDRAPSDFAVEVVPTQSDFTADHAAGPLRHALPFKVSVVADGNTELASGALTLSGRRDEQGRPIYEWKPKGLDSNNEADLSLRALPDLGTYSDKLAKLQSAVADAAAAARDRYNSSPKGHDQLDEHDRYILDRMKTYLQTDEHGSLKNDEGFARFFALLPELRTEHDPRNARVAQAAKALTGFSYLTPPEPGKPLLVHVPGAGGEPEWRGARTLLGTASGQYNIVGYAYDPVTPSADQMTDNFRTKFRAAGLNEHDTVIVALSMGATLVHNAALKEARAKETPESETLLSRSRVVCAGFLPGGASRILDMPEMVVKLAPHAYPLSAGLLHMMSPGAPISSDIAQHMPEIQAATDGITYFESPQDRYLGFSIRDDASAGAREKQYLLNRDTAFKSMEVTYVDPPNLYVPNNKRPEDKRDMNAHINLLHAPELAARVAEMGESAPRLAKPRSSLELIVEISPQEILRVPLRDGALPSGLLAVTK